jgi:acetyl esterase/lipase
MNRRRRGLFLGLMAGAGVAQAGPLREALRERIEQRRQERESSGVDGEEEALQGRASGGRTAPVSLPAGARVLRDLSYGPDAQQRFDVYIPAGARSAPVVFMVHGGAWMVGDKGYAPVVNQKVTRWLPLGYVLVSINYRMSRAAPDVLAQADDVARALAHVQAQAATWGADPAQVLLMGHSAGAHLVALLAADAELAARHGCRPWLGMVSLDSAALDVVATMESRHYRFYDKVFGRDRAKWLAASPYHRLHAKPAPMLLVCSTRRGDSCPQAESFAAKARQLGGRATVLPVDMKHGETNTDLGKASVYTDTVHAFMRGLGMP